MNRNTSACWVKTCQSPAFLKGLLPFQRQEIALPLRDAEKKAAGGGGGDSVVFSFSKKLTSRYLDETLFTLCAIQIYFYFCT